MFPPLNINTLRAKLSGAVYCYRSSLCVCNGRAGVVCVWVYYHDNSFRASIFTKLDV